MRIQTIISKTSAEIAAVFVLAAFGLAQPLYNILGKYPEFFVIHHSRPIDLITFCVLLSLLIPGILLIISWLAGLVWRPLRRFIIYSGVLFFGSLFLTGLFKSIDYVPGFGRIVISAILAAVFLWKFRTKDLVRRFVLILSPAVLFFPGVFLLNPQITKILLEPASMQLEGSVASTAPIVLVIFDEFPTTSLMNRKGHINAERYPNFSALADNSYWFRNATTVSASTEISVPVILTGRYPDKKRLPNSTDYPRNLFTLVGSSYDIVAFERATELCPNALCVDSRKKQEYIGRMTVLLRDISVVYGHVVLPKDLTNRLPSIRDRWTNFGGKEVKKDRETSELAKQDRRNEFETFVASIAPGERPRLFMLHILLPHVQWSYLPSGKGYGSVVGDSNAMDGWSRQSETWADNRFLVEQSMQRHLLQVGFVDRLLGKLIARLKEVGLYDPSLIVITADHGVSFIPGQTRRGVTKETYHDIIPVPLFIKKPGQKKGYISDRNVQTVDVLPTITDVLGISTLWELDGHSAFDTEKDEDQQKRIVLVNEKQSKTIFFGPNLQEMYQTVDKKIDLFGEKRFDSPSKEFFRVGPFSDWIGRRINPTDIIGTAPFKVKFDNGFDFSRVDLSTSYVPVHITGRLHDSAHQIGHLLVVTINEIIQAVVPTFKSLVGDVKFSAIVPESGFEGGFNKVEAFLVENKDDGVPTFKRILDESALAYHIQEKDGTIELRRSDGKTFKLVTKSIRGVVSSAYVRDGRLRISGWAADIEQEVPPKRIVFFSNGVYLHDIPLEIPRPDVAQFLKNDNYNNTGFSVDLPISLVPDPSDMDLRVFAITQSKKAQELDFQQE